MNDYTSLKKLVGDEFTVEEAYGYKWKKWEPEAKKMLQSDTYEEGFKKVYSVKTDKGVMDLSPSQLGQLLEATYQKGKADINQLTFVVKSNGKDGMDIRYFLNLKRTEPKKESDDLPDFY